MIFHSGAYRYRKPSVGFVGVALVLVCGAFLAWLALGAPRAEWSWKSAVEMVLSFGVGGLMFGIGVALTVWWAQKAELKLTIDEDGVRYGKKFYAWDRIKRFGAYAERGRCQVFLQTKGFSPDRLLLTDEGLSETECEQLLETLEERVLPGHAKLELG